MFDIGIDIDKSVLISATNLQQSPVVNSSAHHELKSMPLVTVIGEYLAEVTSDGSNAPQTAEASEEISGFLEC